MQARAYQTVLVEVAEHVATITLNRPEKRNTIGPQMANELVYALDDARDDADVRVVVLTGAGTTFCAGGDLSQMAGGADSAAPLPFRGDFAELLLRFPQLGKPVIARVQGPAMGGGCGLVASCDFAVAAESATLGTPEIKRGLFPFMIMAVLSRVVPRRKLVEMMLLGEKLSARDALAVGLLSEVVADGELDTRVTELAEKLAAQSPTAMRFGLRAFHKQADDTLEASIPWLRDQLGAILGTEDAREGLTAFLEKRAPRWTGK